MSTVPVAEASGVTKSYKLGAATVPAVRNVSLAVRSGELVALAGPSGSGKSTLLHLIGCLDRPDTGNIRLGELLVSHMPAGRLAAVRRDRLGFIFQSFNLVPVLTARENVEYPLLLTSAGPAERRGRVDELLERVGLADKHGRRPRELSGGERQRVAIARALVNRPALVLADEPTANLDSATGGAVLDLMDDLRDRLGVAFLFASHDPRLIARMDRVVNLRDGALAPASSTHSDQLDSYSSMEPLTCV
jgi:putative ABC transport system ATP-binding protein